MSNTLKAILPYLIVGIFCFILGVLGQKGCTKPKTIVKEVPYWQKPGFTTDTQKVPHYEKDPISQKPSSPLPPLRVIVYDTLPFNPYTPTVIRDTVWMEKGKDRYRVNPNFLSLYPGHPKIIFGKFTNDTISLDLFDTSGTLTRNIYKVPLNDFSFYYDEGTMRFTELSTPSIPKITETTTRFFTSSYVFINYEPFQRKPQIAMDYSINYGRFAAYTMGAVDYRLNEKDIKAQVRLGLRFKLK